MIIIEWPNPNDFKIGQINKLTLHHLNNYYIIFCYTPYFTYIYYFISIRISGLSSTNTKKEIIPNIGFEPITCKVHVFPTKLIRYDALEEPRSPGLLFIRQVL